MSTEQEPIQPEVSAPNPDTTVGAPLTQAAFASAKAVLPTSGNESFETAIVPINDTENTVVTETESGPAARGYAIIEGRGPIDFEGKSYTNDNLTHRIAQKIIQFAPFKFAGNMQRGYYSLDDPYWEGVLSNTENVMSSAALASTAVVDRASVQQVPCVNCPQ